MKTLPSVGATGWLNKVPEVALSFWIVKIMSTTVGESGARNGVLTRRLLDRQVPGAELDADEITLTGPAASWVGNKRCQT